MTPVTHSLTSFEKIYDTPHHTAPFDRIRTEEYEPAMREGMRQHEEEIQQIIHNPEAPNFENTIVALERSGELLDRVTDVFFNLLEAESNDEMQELAQKLSPVLSEHANRITLNEALFARVKAVFEAEHGVRSGEELRLLESTYDSFVRSGANLNETQKQRYRELSKELSQLTVQFGQNHLKETNSYLKVITDEAVLEGMPESALTAAKETAKEKGVEGWPFTLQAPSYVPFLTYCGDRNLRKELYLAYQTQCSHENENSNLELVKRIVNTRMELAQLLGYHTYAEFVLKKRMAEDAEHVYRLLNQLLEAYTPTARKEVEELTEFASRLEGTEMELMPWDWSYYSEKLKKEKYHFDTEMLRPYFPLKQVIDGVFGLAHRLYGISFKENAEIPVYHPDVKAFEVFDKDGSYLAVLYADFHPRETKQSGAWMTEYKNQWKRDGENSRPHVSITMNFTKPTADKPALLTLGEVETFLHEFGHALHGIFADTTYASLSGTHVYRDFVELPSQIMENFAIEKEFLHTFAKHYLTGEDLPDEYIERIVEASNYHAAYACLRQVSFGLLDMAWYDRSEAFDGEVRAFEKEAWERAQVLPQVAETCMSVQFSHIMDGGYSAGYYSYKWAEVLDADAFSLFKEKGIFTQEVAESFRRELLSKGGTVHPMTLYKRFRGQEPTIDALLKRNGIK
jgi:peptidyl-dipeptidase Dcp